MTLRLYGKNGRPVSNGPAFLSVQSTQFGSTLLFIIFAALGVLVLTAIARAIRRGLRDTPGGPGDGAPGDGDGDNPPPGAAANAFADMPEATTRQNDHRQCPLQAGGDATVETGNDATESRYPPEAPDDHARARDWARYA